jgi:hypothetical protein
MNNTPKTPIITRVSEDVFKLSAPVIVDGEKYWFVKYSEGLSTILGDVETYNVFVCDEAGEVLDWGGLCHQDTSFDGPGWLYSLENVKVHTPLPAGASDETEVKP